MKKASLVLALLLCCTSMLWMTACGDRTGTVTGTVTYKDGSPAVGLEVVGLLLSDDTDLLAWTDSEGRYVLKNAPPGGLEVVVSQSDSLKVTCAVTVQSNQESVLDIELPW